MHRTLFVAAAMLFTSLVAHADTLSFNYQAGSISASGTFTATFTGNNTYTVTGISGSRDGIAIAGLSNYEGSDNVLNLNNAVPVDYNGISYQLANGLMVNLFASQNYPGTARELLPSGNNPSNGGFALNVTAVPSSTTPSSVTPEPSSLALLGTGLLGVGGAMKRRFA